MVDSWFVADVILLMVVGKYITYPVLTYIKVFINCLAASVKVDPANSTFLENDENCDEFQ